MFRSSYARAVCLTLICSCALGSAASVAAQGQPPDRRVVVGTVQDASGGVVPGATVVVRQLPVGLERLLAAAEDGRVEISDLPPGRYALSVSAPGFGPVTEIIEVPLQQPVNVTLAPAPIVEQLTVVSASRQEELRESLNTRVDVISRTRIEESGGHETVGELLREIPGVVTRRGSLATGAAGEQIQGIDSRQVLVLIDGQPIAGARGIKRGGVLDLDRQSSARLERVEVVKGAASALYGSEAIGGVINLITRQPASPFDATVAIAAGNFGAFGARADSGFRHASTSGFLSVERHQHDGFDLTPGTFDTTSAPYRRYDLLGKIQHAFSPALAVDGLMTGYRNVTRGRSIGELGPQEDDLRDHGLSGNLAARWAGRSTSVEARAYLSSFEERAMGRFAPPRSGPLPPASLEQRFQKVDLTVVRPLGTRHLLQGGVEWARDHYEGINRVRDEEEGHRADTAVAWAQHRWSATSRLTTTIGARVDRRSRFETAVSPKIAANLRVTDQARLRASYGRGFRAPDLGQLYYRFLSPSNFYQVIGNPSLSPEYADSWQAGGDLSLANRRLRLGLNLFRNDVRDLIESVSLGFVATPGQLSALLEREGLDPSFRPALGRPLFTYRNVSDVVTQGVEIDSEAALTPSVTVGGGYTYLDARDADTDRALTGRHRHHGHVRASWSPGRSGLRAGVRGTFYSDWIAARAAQAGGGVQDTIAPAFALWDIFASQQIGGGLSAFVNLDNVTDSQDPNTGVLLPTGSPAPLYRPEAGRTLRIGVQWSLAAR